MKFDETLQFIAENTVPVAGPVVSEKRPENPAFAKWKAENPGVPTYKFYKMQRELKKGGKTPPVANLAAPATPADSFKELPDTLRTKEAVADFLQHNPGASFEEVMDAITPQSSEETPLNLDPEVVKSAIASTSGGVSSAEGEPDIESLKKADLASKYEKMRKALYAARGLKSRPGRKPVVKDPEMDVDYDGEEGGMRRGINMRDEPVDPNEL